MKRVEEIQEKKQIYTTDESMKSKPKKKSKYLDALQKTFHIDSLSNLNSNQISKETGVPLAIIEKVRKKGHGAYKSGHRPGVSKWAWANARLASFLTLGCTSFSSDAMLLKEVYKMRKSKAREKLFTQPIQCPKYKIEEFRKRRKDFPSFLFDENNKYKK